MIKDTLVNGIAGKHCTKAFDFVTQLRRTDPYWLNKDDWGSEWIFRGQASDKWQLTPSAWRNNNDGHGVRKRKKWETSMHALQMLAHQFQLNNGEETLQRIELTFQQANFEFELLEVFSNQMNEMGLTVPIWPIPSKPYHSLILEGEPDSKSLFPIAALAQHHGIPTCLLDWTENPLVAAFFATELPVDCKDENIIVWALNRNAEIDCNYLEVQRSQYGFLHAQEGLFTYILDGAYRFVLTGKWPCLTKAVNPANLRRITMPVKEVPELVRLLWVERISKAFLMPSLDNVSKALERAWSCL